MISSEIEIIDFTKFEESRYCLEEFTWKDYILIGRYVDSLINAKVIDITPAGIVDERFDCWKILKKSETELYVIRYYVGFEIDLKNKPIFMWYALQDEEIMKTYYEFNNVSGVFYLKKRYVTSRLLDLFSTKI